MMRTTLYDSDSLRKRRVLKASYRRFEEICLKTFFLVLSNSVLKFLTHPVFDCWTSTLENDLRSARLCFRMLNLDMRPPDEDDDDV